MARTYPATSCPVATALSAIGDRWTLLILRDLFLNESRRFQDLQGSLAGCAPTTLTQRLRSLETDGLVARRLYEERPPRHEYVLTPKGRDAAPVLQALRAWGLKLQRDA